MWRTGREHLVQEWNWSRFQRARDSKGHSCWVSFRRGYYSATTWMMSWARDTCLVSMVVEGGQLIKGSFNFASYFFSDIECMGWLVLYDRELIGKSKFIFIVMQFRFIYTNICTINATAIQLLNKWSKVEQEPKCTVQKIKQNTTCGSDVYLHKEIKKVHNLCTPKSCV